MDYRIKPARKDDSRTDYEKRDEIWGAIFNAGKALSLLAIAIRTELFEHEVARLTRYCDWFVTEDSPDGLLISIATKTPKR